MVALAPDLAAFIRANTRLTAPPLLPELRLYLADEPFGLWERVEAQAGQPELPVPFWAFPWAGGIALARYLLDHPEEVAGRTVLDLAAGSGLVAIAAARAGAAAVTASEIDPLALAVIALNAAANGVTLAVAPGDLLGGGARGADLVVAGDACYEKLLAQRVLSFLGRAQAGGARGLVGDPGRAFLPRAGLEAIARYDVPAWPGLEDARIKPTTVWRPA
jgi:predicted nicotinamide N-methyase